MKTKMLNINILKASTLLIYLICALSLLSLAQRKKSNVNKSVLPKGNYLLTRQYENDKLKEIDNPNAVINFESNQKKINGTVGCNRLNGTFSSNKKNALKLKLIAMTRIACNDNVESTFINNMSKVTNYKIKGSALYLYNNQKVIIELQKQEEPIISRENIQGTYQLIHLFKEGKSVTGNFEKTKITIQDGNISCNVGCNSIGGNFVTENNKIKPMQLMMTEMYCEHVAELEQTFTGNLEHANRYTLKNGLLELYQDNLKLMVLKNKD